MYIYMRMSVYFVRVCVFVHECGGKCVLCERGAQRGATISCVQVAFFEGWLGGGVRTCRPCVWEPRAPHFSYIVLLLLQTVNSTKDAQLIVARDSWGGRAMGRRQAKGGGVWLSLSLVWLPWLPPLLSSLFLSYPLTSPVVSSSLLSSSLFAQLCHLAPLKRIWPGWI